MTEFVVGCVILGALAIVAILVMLMISYPWQMIGLSLMMGGTFLLGACAGAFAKRARSH